MTVQNERDHHSDYEPAQLALFGAAAIVLSVFVWIVSRLTYCAGQRSKTRHDRATSRCACVQLSARSELCHQFRHALYCP